MKVDVKYEGVGLTRRQVQPSDGDQGDQATMKEFIEEDGRALKIVVHDGGHTIFQ